MLRMKTKLSPTNTHANVSPFSPKSLFFNSFFLLIFLYFGMGRGRAQAWRLQRPHNQRFWNLQWFAGYIVGIWKAFIQLAPGEEKHGTRLEKRAFSSINLHGNIKSQARTRSLLSRLWMLARPPSLFLPTPPLPALPLTSSHQCGACCHFAYQPACVFLSLPRRTP